MIAAARFLSTVFQPALMGTYILVALGLGAAEGAWTGLIWALGLAALSAGLPALDILRRMRARTVTDFHIVLREQRSGPLLVALAATALALALAWGLDAPRLIQLGLLTALTTGAVLTGVTTVWKISFHSAIVSSGVILLAGLLGLWALALAPLVPAVGWSRVALRRHTPGQVTAGVVVGTGLTAAVLALAGGA
ncbi:MAG: hypothetical protein KKA32_13420 [Actinobacteria bacterium]|nr:hypothetical protein [Actinomycetota bacterium]